MYESNESAAAKKKIKQIIVVEGKYDSARLHEVFDCVTVETNGFGIFKNAGRKKLVKLLGEKNGAIILTDSDKAGMQIRNFVKQLLPEDKITHVYLPDVYGKERRKRTPSKEGKLGVEGISAKIIEEAFEAQAVVEPSNAEERITKADLYELSLSGGKESSKRRRELQKKLNLPEELSANAFIDILNVLMTKRQLYDLAGK